MIMFFIAFIKYLSDVWDLRTYLGAALALLSILINCIARVLCFRAKTLQTT
jgi:hypothetical protein